VTEGFIETITVQNTSGDTLGTIDLGQTVELNGDVYTLQLDNGILFLSLSHSEIISNRSISSETVIVTANQVYVSAAVNIGGCFRIQSGGTANHTSVNTYGYSYVSQAPRGMHVSSGGVANDTTVSGTFASLYVSSGGVANNVKIKLDGRADASAGGVINNTTVNTGGWLHALSGGVVNNATINGIVSGVSICSAGIMNNVTVSSGGKLHISSGGTLRGSVWIATGTLVSAFEGAIIDFDLSGVEPGAATRFNNLSRITGWADAVYTITVSDTQAEGTYTLAESAAEFNGTITVQNKLGDEIGTLSVGEVLLNGDKSYVLNLVDDALSLTVGSSSLDDIIASNPTSLTIAGDGTYAAAVYLNGIQSVSVEDGSFNKQLYGGQTVDGNFTSITSIGTKANPVDAALMINGGSFNENVYGGDKLNLGYLNHYGDISMTINGGTFNGAVAGGIRHNKSDISKPTFAMHDGSINLTITSGSFIESSGKVNSGWIFGGTYATKKLNSGLTLITGDVTTTLDVASGDTIHVDKCIVAGSYGSGAIGGNVKLVLSGAGRIEVGEKLWGACDGDYYPTDKSLPFQTVIGGDRLLSFTGFTGTLACPKIRAFKSMEFVGGTSVSLSEKYDLADIENWTFEYGSDVHDADFINAFKGDTLNLLGFSGITSEQTLITAASGSVFVGFDELGAIKMDGTAVTKTFANNAWTFSSNSTNYKLSLEGSGTSTCLVLSLA
jgi:autotransporter passenger strand-loop-strand repeat protein